MTVTDRDRARAREWLKKTRVEVGRFDSEKAALEVCVPSLAAEFAAVAQEAEREAFTHATEARRIAVDALRRDAFKRTREATLLLINEMRSGRDWGGGFELFECDEGGVSKAIRALTFEQVMGGEK